MSTTRPKLKLNKTIAPAPLPTKAPEPKKKSVKPNPNAEKERLKLENIKRDQEAYARRKEQIEKLQPIVDAYFLGKPIMAEVVLIGSVACLKPLAIGVRKTIFAALKAQPTFDNCTNTVLNDLISTVLKRHTSKPEYLAGVLKFADRFSIDGAVTGEVTQQHKASAARKNNQKQADVIC